MRNMQPRVLNMTSFCKPQFLIPYLHANKYFPIQRPFSTKPVEFILNSPKVSNFTLSLCLNPSPQILSCSASSSSLTQPNDAESSTIIIFVKGLPLSTSEGRLKMAFASYGDVNRVKIILDKITREPLGFAYIWVSSPESAQTAVKEMNGEVYLCFNCETWLLYARARPSPLKF